MISRTIKQNPTWLFRGQHTNKKRLFIHVVARNYYIFLVHDRNFTNLRSAKTVCGKYHPEKRSAVEGFWHQWPRIFMSITQRSISKRIQFFEGDGSLNLTTNVLRWLDEESCPGGRWATWQIPSKNELHFRKIQLHCCYGACFIGRSRAMIAVMNLLLSHLETVLSSTSLKHRLLDHSAT